MPLFRLFTQNFFFCRPVVTFSDFIFSNLFYVLTLKWKTFPVNITVIFLSSRIRHCVLYVESTILWLILKNILWLILKTILWLILWLFWSFSMSSCIFRSVWFSLACSLCLDHFKWLRYCYLSFLDVMPMLLVVTVAS